MTERRYNGDMHRIRDAVANSDWADMGHVSPTSIHQGYVFFDDALAAHDAEVAANALRNAVDLFEASPVLYTSNSSARARIADEADRIEREASEYATV